MCFVLDGWFEIFIYVIDLFRNIISFIYRVSLCFRYLKIMIEYCFLEYGMYMDLYLWFFVFGVRCIVVVYLLYYFINVSVLRM